MNTDPVENFLKGVPIITSKERAVVLQPLKLPEIPLKNSLDGNDSRGFAYNNAEITLEKTSFKTGQIKNHYIGIFLEWSFGRMKKIARMIIC